MVTKSTGRDSKELITRAAVRRLLIFGGTHYCACTVDQQAERIFQLLVSVLSKQENVTERLKVNRPMEWVQKTNSIRNRAVEIVNNEWIYI